MLDDVHDTYRECECRDSEYIMWYEYNNCKMQINPPIMDRLSSRVPNKCNGRLLRLCECKCEYNRRSIEIILVKWVAELYMIYIGLNINIYASRKYRLILNIAIIVSDGDIHWQSTASVTCVMDCSKLRDRKDRRWQENRNWWVYNYDDNYIIFKIHMQIDTIVHVT